MPTEFGGLVGLRSLVVRDSFGENVLISPTETAAAGRATAPWRMFRQSDAQLGAGAGPAPALLFLAPVIAGALDGEAIEEVVLLRDEMANLAWAVERVVEGADGRAAQPQPGLCRPAQRRRPAGAGEPRRPLHPTDGRAGALDPRWCPSAIRHSAARRGRSCCSAARC